MKVLKVLHIDCSLRKEQSLSRDLSKTVVDQLSQKREITVDRLDLAVNNPGHITQLYAEAMYMPYGQHNEEMLKELSVSDTLVDRLVNAELVVIGTPMYNFGIPSNLKSYIDHIVRSGRTFKADESGFHGLLNNKKLVVVNSRGGAYADEALAGLDHVVPYLTTIFNFIGITDVSFIPVEPTAFYGDEAKQQAVIKAMEMIKSIVASL